MVWLRLIVAVLLLGAFAVAVIPLLVLIDLVSGGTGYGLCAAGIRECVFGYLRPVELVAWLAGSLFVFVAAIRIVVRLSSRFTGRAGTPPPR